MPKGFLQWESETDFSAVCVKTDGRHCFLDRDWVCGQVSRFLLLSGWTEVFAVAAQDADILLAVWTFATSSSVMSNIVTFYYLADSVQTALRNCKAQITAELACKTALMPKLGVSNFGIITFTEELKSQSCDSWLNL